MKTNEDQLIKQILSNNLEKTSDEVFNDKIISKLNASKTKIKTPLFTDKFVFGILMILPIFVFLHYFDSIRVLFFQHISIGLIIVFCPLYFIIFNKIYQSKNSIK